MARETLYEPLSVRRFLTYALIAPVALFALLFFWRAVLAWQKGYAWSDMDWDSSGHTSIGEFLRATNVGHRIVAPNGRLCAEFFELDTGRRIRMDCSNTP